MQKFRCPTCLTMLEGEERRCPACRSVLANRSQPFVLGNRSRITPRRPHPREREMPVRLQTFEVVEHIDEQRAVSPGSGPASPTSHPRTPRSPSPSRPCWRSRPTSQEPTRSRRETSAFGRNPRWSWSLSPYSLCRRRTQSRSNACDERAPATESSWKPRAAMREPKRLVPPCRRRAHRSGGGPYASPRRGRVAPYPGTSSSVRVSSVPIHHAGELGFRGLGVFALDRAIDPMRTS
jgi:hypothetical protein